MTLENTNKVWIFHHYDADGYAAAAILGSKYFYLEKPFRTHYNENVEFIPVNYDKPIDFSQIEKDDEVWILDYSLSRKDDLESIDDLFDRFGNELKFTWIDHHATALKSISESKGLRGFLEKRGGVFVTEDFEQAGCALMWIYMELGNSIFNMYYREFIAIELIVRVFKDIMKSAPDWVKWTADHDIFSGLYKESHMYSAGVYHMGVNKVYLDRKNPNSYINLSMTQYIAEHMVDLYDFDTIFKNNESTISCVTKDIYELGQQVTTIRNGIYQKNLYNAFDISVEIKVSKDFIQRI